MEKRPAPKYNLETPSVKSQASAASLRSREGSAPLPAAPAAAQQPQTSGNESVAGGGNVRVVVRVRGVNARGKENSLKKRSERRKKTIVKIIQT